MAGHRRPQFRQFDLLSESGQRRDFPLSHSASYFCLPTVSSVYFFKSSVPIVITLARAQRALGELEFAVKRMHLSSAGAFKIMAISRITISFRFVACALFICTAVVYERRSAFGQTTDSSEELTQEAEPRPGTSQFPDQRRENQQPSCAQEAATNVGCSVHGFFHDTWSETLQFGHGLKAVPRGARSSQQFEMGAANLGGRGRNDR